MDEEVAELNRIIDEEEVKQDHEVFKLPEPRVSSTHEDSKEFSDILAQVTYNHPGKRNNARSKQ
jgi:hypothetical protein